jgi:putative flippase GtrA
VRYALVQVAGLAVNFGVFAACLAASAALRRTPVIALAVGAAAALAFNFVSARTIAFRRRAHAS